MLNIKEVESVLRNNKLPEATVSTVIKQLKEKEEVKKDNKDTEKSKKQYVVISTNKDTAFVVQINEGDDAATAHDKVNAAIKDFNNSKKGQKNPIKSLNEGFSLPRRFLVAHNIWVKTKEAARLIAVE